MEITVRQSGILGIYSQTPTREPTCNAGQNSCFEVLPYNNFYTLVM